jgi:hypothetical protein
MQTCAFLTSILVLSFVCYYSNNRKRIYIDKKKSNDLMCPKITIFSVNKNDLQLVNGIKFQEPRLNHFKNSRYKL